MSGPKCDSYYVEDGRNELLLQAQRAEAERAARLANERLDAAIAHRRDAQARYGTEIDSLHEHLPSFPSGTSSVEEIERYIAKVDEAVTHIAAEIGRAEGLAELRSLVGASTVAAQVADWSGELHERGQTAGRKGAEAEFPSRKKFEERADRIAARLQGTANEEELRSIKALVVEIVGTASAGRAENLETELRMRVQQVNERIQRTQSDMAEATRLLKHLRGLQGREIESVRQELDAIIGNQKRLPSDLSERTHEICKRALRKADDEYAGMVMREELQRLGYNIGEEFSTLFVTGGETVVSRPEEPEYGVQMNIDAAKGILDLAVIRFADTPNVDTTERRLRDKTAEERWCVNHDKLRTAIRIRGLNGRVIKHVAPGAQAVKVVTSALTKDMRRPGRLKQRKINSGAP